MWSPNFQKYHLIICLIIGIHLSNLNVDAKSDGITNENQERNSEIISVKNVNADKFKCPALFGMFADIEDCSKYYLCVAGFPTHLPCGPFKKFDKYRRKCISFVFAVCDKEPLFVCPAMFGYFPHPKDCSKYYICNYFVPSLETCPKTTFFDDVNISCDYENRVSCGSRKKPTGEDRDPSYICPSPFGYFPHHDDCSKYYLCNYNASSLETCPEKTLFDEANIACNPESKVICGSRRRPDPSFKCPGMFGYFPHSKDCSKYYICNYFVPSINTCPENTLFDDKKIDCSAESKVNCGSRKKPTDKTTIPTPIPNPITPKFTIPEKTTPEPTTPEPTTPEPTTPEPTTPEPTTPEPTTPEPTTPEPTTPEPTTEEETTILEQTAPETNCEEDDLDCIITETGEIPSWFKCPRELDSYRHPLSNKLFIFCINWKPYVKRCGQDLIYLQKLKTCVPPEYPN